MEIEELMQFIENRCNEIELPPKRRLRRNTLLMIGYITGFVDAVNASKKNQTKKIDSSNAIESKETKVLSYV
jgi:hypothetical protein